MCTHLTGRGGVNFERNAILFYFVALKSNNSRKIRLKPLAFKAQKMPNQTKNRQKFQRSKVNPEHAGLKNFGELECLSVMMIIRLIILC